MQVAKWGNSLAVRLPKQVVEALGLKEGDQVELVQAGPKTLEVMRDAAREAALQRMRQSKWEVPEGYKFDREEINSR
jgi:antitoxin MazE